jgi:Fic family protein
MVQVSLERLTHLAAEWAALQPLTAEHREKLHKKMRLEWNYNSNHIEGNTLTYGETELLLIFGETKGNHEFREYNEMKGHDVALKMVEELAADPDQPLTEAFIRELNRVILKEPFYKEAVTPDGQPTRRLISIGEYKRMPNSVRLPNGELFHYASPTETPAKMQELLDWYREAAANADLHPVVVGAELHYRFVLIHPFDDGNGRLSRLLMNYHLLRCGHLPVIIQSADKRNYLRALHEADTGNVVAFVAYIADSLLWSYEIGIKAAKGESVEEQGDWEKEIELLKKSTPPDLVADKKKSFETLPFVWNNCLLPFLGQLLPDLKKIGDLFDESAVSIFRDNTAIDSAEFKGHFSMQDVFDKITTEMSYMDQQGRLISELRIQFDWKGYKFAGTNTFDGGFNIEVAFLPQKYCIKYHTDEKKNVALLYSQFLSADERTAIVAEIKTYVLQQIKRWAKG